MSYTAKPTTEKPETVEEFMARTGKRVKHIPEGMRTLERFPTLRDTAETFRDIDNLTGGTLSDSQLLVMSERANIERGE